MSRQSWWGTWIRPSVSIPLLVLALGTLLFRFTEADLAISGMFFCPASFRWPLATTEPWRTLYQAGQYPGLALGVLGLAMVLGSLVCARLRPWRRAGLFLVALLVIGPGLITNLVLKEGWGRPRPDQVYQFGGNRPFSPVGQIAFGQNGKSFPSGHAAMGFYLMAPTFLLYRRYPRLARIVMVVGLAAGCSLGLGRIVQGRHYASDVLWSFGIVYFTAVALYAWLRPDRPPAATCPNYRATNATWQQTPSAAA